MKKILTLLVAALLFAPGAGVAAEPAMKLVLEGDKAITVTDVAGKAIPGKDFFGAKRTVLIFSQTACANCRGEISFLMGQAKDFPKLNFAVAIVDMKVDAARIGSFLEAVSFKGTALIDPAWDLASKLGVSSTPATAIVDKDGTVLFTHAGYTGDSNKILLDALKKAN